MAKAEVNIRESYPIIIGNQEIISEDRHSMDAVSPATGEVVAKVPLAQPDVVDLAVEGAAEAQIGWSSLSMAERGAYLNKFADALRKESERLSAIDSFDSGNPFFVHGLFLPL